MAFVTNEINDPRSQEANVFSKDLESGMTINDTEKEIPAETEAGQTDDEQLVRSMLLICYILC